MGFTNIAEMAKFYLNWLVLMIFPLQEGPVRQTGEFKQSLDSFYDTDSSLSVTNIAEMALFHSNWLAFMNFPLDDGPVSQTSVFKQCFDS